MLIFATVLEQRPEEAHELRPGPQALQKRPDLSTLSCSEVRVPREEEVVEPRPERIAVSQQLRMARVKEYKKTEQMTKTRTVEPNGRLNSQKMRMLPAKPRFQQFNNFNGYFRKPLKTKANKI